MKFSSPWQSRYFAKWVTVTRHLLRPFGTLEQKFIFRLVDNQNKRVHKHLSGKHPSSVLLIMPRCVKLSGCRADVQNSLSECRACRLCPLGDVARLCARFQIQALVAFRSHIAFELARKIKPDLIIATACLDRLIKALCSVPEFPALLTPLSSMEKKCSNARLDLGWLEGQLVSLTPRNFDPDIPAPSAEYLQQDLPSVGSTNTAEVAPKSRTAESS